MNKEIHKICQHILLLPLLAGCSSHGGILPFVRKFGVKTLPSFFARLCLPSFCAAGRSPGEESPQLDVVRCRLLATSGGCVDGDPGFPRTTKPSTAGVEVASLYSRGRLSLTRLCRRQGKTTRRLSRFRQDLPNPACRPIGVTTANQWETGFSQFD